RRDGLGGRRRNRRLDPDRSRKGKDGGGDSRAEQRRQPQDEPVMPARGGRTARHAGGPSRGPQGAEPLVLPDAGAQPAIVPAAVRRPQSARVPKRNAFSHEAMISASATHEKAF